jgi:hypothetical protein
MSRSNRLCPRHKQTLGWFHELTWAPALMLPQGWCHGARTWITEYIKGCATCQQNKNLTHCIIPLMFCIPSTISAKPFSHIAMDLITGLPKSDGHDTILTIVDHGCSQGAIFLPCSTTITGMGITQLYLEHIFQWFGLPQRIISDWDPCFTSHFAKGLTQGPPNGWLIRTDKPMGQTIPVPYHHQSEQMEQMASHGYCSP